MLIIADSSALVALAMCKGFERLIHKTLQLAGEAT
jgi:hypothetical protein